MNPYLDKYLALLWRMFEYDIEILSQPWMYYWLLVPAFCYVVFFLFKWIILTTPIWLPPSMILQSLKRTKKSKK